MANDREVSAVLAFLHELFPTREIGPATLDAFAMIFEDWPDGELTDCAKKAARERGRTFFPTPGEISAYRALPTVDSGAMLRRISALGSYNPNGWIYPRLEKVRDEFGPAIAQAYADAGAERCFAGDESITQDIARRSFDKALGEVAVREPEALLLAGSAQKFLPPAA